MQNVYYKVMMKCQCSCIIKHFAPLCVRFHEAFLNKSNANDTEMEHSWWQQKCFNIPPALLTFIVYR